MRSGPNNSQRASTYLALGRQSGFTLIEMMVTISVLAILVSLAAPSFRENLVRNRAGAISNEFTSSISKARVEAVNRNVCVSICRSTLVPSTTTSQPRCDSGTNWNNGWIAFVNTACDDTIDEPIAEDLVLASGPFNTDFSLISSGTNQTKLMFSPVGQLRPGDVGKFNLQYQSTGIAYAPNRGICVSRLGRTFLIAYGTTPLCP
jgi:type IV fimbrial biogenesis protein FimT